MSGASIWTPGSIPGSSPQFYPVSQAKQTKLKYNSADSVLVYNKTVQMSGFRACGCYTETVAPVFNMPETKVARMSGSGLGAESSVRTESWYAVFACANAGDTAATLKTMPMLRLGVPTGNVFPLIAAGEGIHALTPQTYAWLSINNLAGVKCLLISVAGNFSSTVVNVIANTAGTITLENPGALTSYDFILPAPPGYTYFCYLASVYFDTGEVRNFYSAGEITKAKMIYILQPAASLVGSVPGPPGVQFNCAGYINPLASGIVLDSSSVYSTASTGAYAEYFDPDGSNHIVQSCYDVKATATTESIVFSNVQVPFLYHQKFYFYNAGAAGILATRANGQFNVTGWFEP